MNRTLRETSTLISLKLDLDPGVSYDSTGMLVSFGGVNYGFWYHLVCSEYVQKGTPMFLAIKVSFRIAR